MTVRYVLVRNLTQARQLEVDPRVRAVCLLVETFSFKQRVGAYVLWRTPVLRWLIRPFIFRRFINPYAAFVFALHITPSGK